MSYWSCVALQPALQEHTEGAPPDPLGPLLLFVLRPRCQPSSPPGPQPPPGPIDSPPPPASSNSTPAGQGFHQPPRYTPLVLRLRFSPSSRDVYGNFQTPPSTYLMVRLILNNGDHSAAVSQEESGRQRTVWLARPNKVLRDRLPPCPILRVYWLTQQPMKTALCQEPTNKIT